MGNVRTKYMNANGTSQLVLPTLNFLGQYPFCDELMSIRLKITYLVTYVIFHKIPTFKS